MVRMNLWNLMEDQCHMDIWNHMDLYLMALMDLWVKEKINIKEEKRVLRNNTGITAFSFSACFLNES